MRLAIVRQDYRPEGAVERGTERALEALLERNVAISLYTRTWPQTRLQLIEPAIIDPFHLGALWRDRGFARAACRAVRRAQPTLVESHERLLCCDVYRAADGVHAVWLEERLKRARRAGRIVALLSPHHRYLLDAERRLYASPWLRAVICGSNMVRDEIRDRFSVPDAKLHVIYNPVDGERLSSGAARGARAIRGTARHRCRSHRLPRRGRRFRARRRRHRHRRVRAARSTGAPGRRRRRRQTSRAIAARAQARGVADRVTLVGAADDRAAVLRRGRRVRAALALRSVAGRRARGHGLRRAGDRQHEGGRRRARARARLRTRLPVRRRRRARRPHAGAAGPADARGLRGQRARAWCCRSRRRRHAAAGPAVP